MKIERKILRKGSKKGTVCQCDTTKAQKAAGFLVHGSKHWIEHTIKPRHWTVFRSGMVTNFYATQLQLLMPRNRRRTLCSFMRRSEAKNHVYARYTGASNTTPSVEPWYPSRTHKPVSRHGLRFNRRECCVRSSDPRGRKREKALRARAAAWQNTYYMYSFRFSRLLVPHFCSGVMSFTLLIDKGLRKMR